MSKIALEDHHVPAKPSALPRLGAGAVIIAIAAVVLAIMVGAAIFPEEPDLPAPWEEWVRNTSLHASIIEHPWMWPMLESLHYLGLSALIGTVGLFDLRVLGVAKAIPPSALHRLIPIGVVAYVLNLLTGICFLSAFPEQYAYNPAFWWKVLFMAIAGVNVAAFYFSPAFREVKDLPAGADASLPAKIMAGTSFAAWIGVLACGRLLTFFRPLFFH